MSPADIHPATARNAARSRLADPLGAAIVRAARQASDRRVVAWLKALMRGERARGGALPHSADLETGASRRW